jgi:hypothetical protein
MTKWQDYFKVVQVDEEGNSDPDSWTWGDEFKFELHDPSGKVVATYKDQKYAVKQAKYRFKKLQKRVEQILLK